MNINRHEHLAQFFDTNPTASYSDYRNQAIQLGVSPFHENTYYKRRASSPPPDMPNSIPIEKVPPKASNPAPTHECLQSSEDTPIPLIAQHSPPNSPTAPYCQQSPSWHHYGIHLIALTISSMAALCIYHTINIAYPLNGIVPQTIYFAFALALGFTPLIIAQSPTRRHTLLNTICTIFLAIDLALPALITIHTTPLIKSLVVLYYTAQMAILFTSVKQLN